MATSNYAMTPANSLFKYLLQAPDFVSLKEILETFNISRRTAFNWLKAINNTLKQNHLDEVINVPRYGYKITDKTKKSIVAGSSIGDLTSAHELEVPLNALDRRTVIVLLLIVQNKYLSINKLAQKFNCSRNTIIKDFKAVNKCFPRLEIVSSHLGHKINCSESAIRITIYELLMQHNKLVYKYIEHLNFPVSKSRELVEGIQQNLQMNFSENSVQQLSYLLVFIYSRIKNDCYVKTIADYNWIANNTTNVLANCKYLLYLLTSKKITEGEVVFLSKIVLCSQATEVNCVNDSLYQDLDQIAQEIIFRYEQLTEQKISYKLFTKVLCNHLYATFFRVKFDIPFSSSEVNEIKRQYPELVKFTAIACAPLEQYLQKRLPSEEVALICLYFGSVNTKGYQDISNKDKIKRASLAEVLVVCTSGIGTSAMLYHELNKMYPLIKFSLPLEIRDLPLIFKHEYQAKLIISTAILPEKIYPIPVIKVKAVLTKHDESIIENFFRQEVPQKIEHNKSTVSNLLSIINEYADVKDVNGLRLSLDKFISPAINENRQLGLPTLGNLLPADRIKFVHNNTLNWQEVLKMGCQLLEKNNIVDNDYFGKIVKLIKQYGPYMLISNDIFLAHAAPSSSNKKVGLSLILLDKPLSIQIRQQKATIVCMFILSPGQKREHERALEQLVDIVRNPDNVKHLLTAHSPQDVRKLLLSI